MRCYEKMEKFKREFKNITSTKNGYEITGFGLTLMPCHSCQIKTASAELTIILSILLTRTYVPKNTRISHAVILIHVYFDHFITRNTKVGGRTVGIRGA